MATAKALDPSRWRAFAKGKALRDAAYLDALEDWVDASNENPRLRLDALEDLERATTALRAAARGHAAEDDLDEWFDDVDQAIAVERKKAQGEQAAEAAEDYDFDNDLRALTDGTVAMLRQLRRGQPTHALIALIGRQCAVRLARRPLRAPARELLATWLGVTAGVRYLAATCTWDDNTITMVVDAPASGLSKLVRLALLKQTGKRFQVRLRSSASEEVDETLGDDADADTAAAQADADSPEAALVEQRGRLAALAPALRRALHEQRSDARKLGALLVFADAKLRRGQLLAARQALDVLSTMLAGAPPQT